MSPKRSINSVKLPQTALAFYIKLYCDRKASIKSRYQNNLIEATKSYLSLTESEKQKVSQKFEECKEKNKVQFFEQLKSAKPYLKIKKTSLKKTDSTLNNTGNKESEENLPDGSPERTPAVSLPLETNSENNFGTERTNSKVSTINSKNTDSTINNAGNKESEEELPDGSLERIPAVSLPLQTNSENNFGTERINSEVPTINEFEENYNILEADQENDEPPPQAFNIEPIPPTIKTGHQLFYLLNSTEDSANISWTSLPQFEKNRYSRAVSLLKKDYISKYKEYLECLSSKELFDHYYKTIF